MNKSSIFFAVVLGIISSGAFAAEQITKVKSVEWTTDISGDRYYNVTFLGDPRLSEVENVRDFVIALAMAEGFPFKEFHVFHEKGTYSIRLTPKADSWPKGTRFKKLTFETEWGKMLTYKVRHIMPPTKGDRKALESVLPSFVRSQMPGGNKEGVKVSVEILKPKKDDPKTSTVCAHFSGGCFEGVKGLAPVAVTLR